MSEIQIFTINEQQESDWDAYVKNHPEGTFFHLSKWRKVIENALGHQTYFLLALRNGEVAGILPLGHIKSVLFGNSLVSTPFGVYGGILSDSEDVASSLENYAIKLAVKLGVDFIEFRNQGQPQHDWLAKDLYVTFKKEISQDEEENMQAIPRKQRAMVRKGIKAGLHSVIENDIENFYKAYSESVRNLGTPVFPKKYFKEILDTFADDVDILTVFSDKNELVASVMSFYYKDEVLPYYGGGTMLARNLKGNDFMYWDLMRHAVSKGMRIFDYGRSKKGTGSYSFKKNWGFEPKDMGYSYKLINASEIPDINPLNPKYQFFIRTWQRLPLPVANFIGPYIARNLG